MPKKTPRKKRARSLGPLRVSKRAREINHLTARADWAHRAIETIENIAERHEREITTLLEHRKSPERLALFAEIAEKFEDMTAQIEAIKSEFHYLKKRITERQEDIHTLKREVETLIHNAPRHWKNEHGNLTRVFTGPPMDPDKL